MKTTTLTPAEMEIAERIALGESKKEVADHTFRSVYTVETTVKNIYEKLGFSKISDLVLWYCGQKFNITFQISEVKRQVFAIALLAIIIFDTAFVDDDFCRARRGRTRARRSDIEIIN